MPAPKKIVAQPKKVVPVSTTKPVDTAKPKAKAPTKKGIDAALDGLE